MNAHHCWSRNILSILALLAWTLPGVSQPPSEADEGWIPLFNGEDLEGWTPKIAGYELGENPGEIFRVADGLLVASHERFDRFDNRFGHLFHETPYSHYRLRLEYRFVGEQAPGGPEWALRNNGVMIHSQPPETMRRDQSFPVSIEVQLLGGDGSAERPTGNLCTPGTHVVMNGQLWTPHVTDSSSPTYHGDQWVRMEIEVLGDRRVRHWINDELVLEYEQTQYDPQDGDAQRLIRDGDVRLTGGYIALQAESHPTHFRAIELLPLDPDEPGEAQTPGR